VDRQCGSGLEAINLAAGLVRAGVGGLYLAGGVESASTAPVRHWPGDPPVRYSRAPFAPPGFPDPGMGEAADLVAAEHGVSRERQDAYAERSHAHAVTRSHELRTELVPVGGLDHDERPRAGLTAARLKRLRPAFVAGGTVTAGNSCGVSDGAAVVAVQAGGHGLRILDWQVSGGDPARPGIALVPAVRTLLDRNRLKAGDLQAVEITEAFAGQVLACLDLLGIDESVVCAGGGAIALGHPWGASGAVLMVRLFTRMVRMNGPDLGLAACAIGGGLGVATLVARV
jgi:acetyl-CoA C-acetyltransferase